MTRRLSRALLALGAAGALAAVACRDATGPAGSGVAPDSLQARALGVGVVQVEWSAVPGASGYRLERRRALGGRFDVIADPVIGAGGARIIYFDERVDPETDYGYRVRALDAFGALSPVSVIAGATTPPPPGVLVRVSTSVPNALASDPDGYTVTVGRAADSSVAQLPPNGARRFAPLAPGAYTVRLSGLAPNCAIAAAERTVTVRDQGVNTLLPVQFDVSCLDPSRGRIVGVVDVTGDAVDPDNFRLVLAGVAADATLPDSVRVVSLVRTVPGNEPGTFDNLRPGSYELELEDVDAPCVLEGAAERQVSVAALSADTVRFAVTCDSDGGGDDRPFTFSSRFDRPQAAPGQRVPVDVTLDVSDDPALGIAGASFSLTFPHGMLRYDSTSTRQLSTVTVNSSQAGAGRLDLIAFSSSPPFPRNAVSLARVWFTVVGAAGTSAITRARLVEATDSDVLIDTALVRSVDDTLAITAGGGTPTNQPPVARANGPYAGTAGQSIAFSSAGSSDPDGSIVAWAWSFGDGTTSTQANPSKSYAAAGTYAVSLTVTDDRGASATSSTTAAVTQGGGGGGSSDQLAWRSTASAIAADSIVRVTITLDLRGDVPETSGPEALGSFVIDSLKWDGSVMRFHAINWGPGIIASYSSATGRLTGIRSAQVGAQSQSGLVTLAVIQFKVTAPRGQGRSTTTATSLGPVIGTSATGFFAYNSRIQVTEATVAVP